MVSMRGYLDPQGHSPGMMRERSCVRKRMSGAPSLTSVVMQISPHSPSGTGLLLRERPRHRCGAATGGYARCLFTTLSELWPKGIGRVRRAPKGVLPLGRKSRILFALRCSKFWPVAEPGGEKHGSQSFLGRNQKGRAACSGVRVPLNCSSRIFWLCREPVEPLAQALSNGPSGPAAELQNPTRRIREVSSTLLSA